MTAVESAVPPTRAAKIPWLHNRTPTTRLVLRWLFIAAATGIGFHATIASVFDSALRGGLNGFVLVIPFACLLAAIGTALRDRSELPIHDRETDVIVGIIGLGMAFMLQAVLLSRYSLYFHLLRLDLMALWLFVLSAAIMLFGLRPVYRFRWPWLLAVTMFPLPYLIAVTQLGGTHTAAGVATLGIAAIATALAVGRTTRRGLLGSVAALVIGGLILLFMRNLTPWAKLFSFQAVPAMAAIVLVAGTLLIHTVRTGSHPVFDRRVEPLAAKQVWSSLPVVLIVAVGLAFAPLPLRGAAPSAQIEPTTFGTPLAAPAGWHLTQTEEYPWVRKLYGEGAVLIRQKFVADVGNPNWDKFARPRAVVVDSVTTKRPFAFTTYPPRVLYSVEQIRQSEASRVPLGDEVEAALVNVIDDDILITWDALDWSWGNRHVAQQVTVFTSDNHEPDAPFPAPTGALWPTLDALITVLLRGNAAVTDDAPAFKDADMLVEFGRGLVAAQLPSGQD